MLVFTLKLLLAHILGDFVLQPNSWIKDKQEKKQKSVYLYLHILVHLIALLVIFEFNLTYFLGIGTIIITHYLIDLAKLILQNDANARVLFFLDQALHLVILVLVATTYTDYSLDLTYLTTPNVILFLIAIFLLTNVSSILMKVIISKWKLEDDTKKSLKNAGAYIGVLERLFIFMFIVLGQWSGIGFLLTAKSVFRFGDLSKANDRKLTEYILIGTLISFGLAILIALGYNYIIEQLPK
ncbi:MULTISPECIES: DUF3307 domain-containing protein [unclassified Cellulophaga]|uniref:DUF3307 domain-containing protein n=1 Tax=unclassified Cellulophaga TaxID=2634405 RepID=UPI0026E2E111|nr:MULTISPECIES: DUF3307 domain-containing protein [unclassified Cellulophaga]MDO6490954.1 DUF3307 domain-containing protein [Cellulophaga sp. 2_MG-2023]MDO6493852.1 DUF3307 domain-containing protein [Cellulophaga sp. 3_MG-2023]